MYTEIKFNGSQTTIALIGAKGLDTILENHPSPPRSLFNGQAVVLPDSDGLDPAEKVDLEQVAQSLQGLIKQVSGNFIQRQELVEAFVTGLVAGEHSFVLGPPGTAKTAVASQLADGIGGKFWRILMNQDTTRDAILGTIDPIALQEGRWERKWSGAATCHLGIFDEIWKSSGQNANILLDLAEERKVREGDIERCVPLLSILAMSNEIPDDSERQAIYDRFLIRLTVGYIKDVSNFVAMLTSDAGTVTIDQAATTDELKLMAAAAELWALHPPQSLMDVIKDLWRATGVNGKSLTGDKAKSKAKSVTCSDRRWRKTLKLSCAYALLQGEEPAGVHAKVAAWTLWNHPDEEKDIRKLVMSKTDPFAGDLLEIQAKLAALKEQAETIDPTNNLVKSEFGGKGGKLVNQIVGVLAKPGVESLANRLNALKTETETLIMDVIRMTG